MITGRWSGEFDPLKPLWRGTWTSGDGKRSLPFELLAVAGIVKTTERRLGHIDVTVSRPVFLSAARTGDIDALQRLVDARVWRAARDMVSNDLRESYGFEPEEYWFYFAPYELGVYAEGSYHVRAPWSELRGMVDANGPAASVASSALRK